MTLPVSVVIPTHNSQSTIERALSSVFAQTGLPREILVVDDCSTDDTCAVVRKIALTSPCPVNLITLDQNVGPSHARNTGWGAATQEYVAFLDSDDSWHPQKLEIQCSWMARHPEQSVTGHLTGAMDKEFDVGDIRTRSFHLRDFLIRNRMSTPTVMVRREIPERFNSLLWYAEDYELWLRILSRTNQITRLEAPLTRLHKADFGESGLSSKLFAMYKGELSALSSIRSKQQFGIIAWSILIAWVTAKYLLRVLRTKARRPS